ncbi:hypothetical protein GGG16DRAFT_119605 [Schizophyllum commune]
MVGLHSHRSLTPWSATSTTSHASVLVLAIPASSELIVADGELAPDSVSSARTTCPTPHSCPIRLPSSPQTTPRSPPEVDARRNTWPQSRRRRDHFALLPAPSVLYRNPGVLLSLNDENTFIRDGGMHVSSVALLASSTLALTSAHATARAPSALSRNDAGTLSLPPTTILDDLALVPVAAAPRMCSTRDSQAEEITLNTTARPSHEGSRPSSATRNDPRVGYRRHIFLHDPEPPEAAVRTPQAREAKVKGPFTLAPHSRRLSGSSRQDLGVIRGTRGLPRRTMRQGWGTPFSSPDEWFLLTPEPPEASARFLGEGCERGGIPLHPRAGKGRGAASPLAPHFVILAVPAPPDACALAFGEGEEHPYSSRQSERGAAAS